MLLFVTFLYFSVQLTLEQQWVLGCWQHSVGNIHNFKKIVCFRIAGSSLLVRFFRAAVSGGLLFTAVLGLLVAVASLVAERRLEGVWASVAAAHGPGSCDSTPRLQSTGSVVVAHGLSCLVACGIFLDQGLNPCLLHWQADSEPLNHKGSPTNSFWLYLIACCWLEALMITQTVKWHIYGCIIYYILMISKLEERKH